MVGFIFGGNTGETPETLKRKRSVAEALAARTSTAPKNVGEGLSAIGNALIYRALMNKVDAGDAAGRASAEADRNAFMSGYRSPVADALMPPSSKSAGIPMPGSAGEVAATSLATGDTYEPFINTIKEGGLTNPYGLAAVAATGRAESGWSAANANRTWSDPSESGQPGTAGGIMSWRGPRYQALAATGDLSPQGQAKFFLQEDPDLIAKLNNAKSLEEAQGLMNRAWAFAGYNRPGGESSRRLAYAKGYLPNFQGGSTEVASLDPSAGMSASDAINAAATPSGYVDPAVASQNAQPAPVTAPAAAQAPEFDAGRFGPRMNLAEMPPTQADIAPQLQTQTAALTGQPSPVVAALARPGSVVDAPAPVATATAAPAAVAPSQPVQSTQAQAKPQEVAQAGPGADYFPAAPNVPSQTGPSMDQIMRVLNNPYATETDKALAMSELERRQKQSDPAYQLEMETKRANLERLKRPGYRIATQEERQAFGIPADDNRPYQIGPEGQISAIGGQGQAQSPGVEARQREALATQYGIDPKSAEGQRFILTGTLPASDKGVTAGDREAIREADDAVNSGEATLSLLDRAMELSGKAYEGTGAGARALVTSQFGSEAGMATREFDNIITEQALGQLKAIFGGAPTEGERAILLEVQGSSSQPQAVRDAILRRARKAVERRVNYNRDRANELRGGTYYRPKPEGEVPVQAPATSGAPTSATASGAQPKSIKSPAEYEALPSGAEFIAPDGSRRRKP